MKDDITIIPFHQPDSVSDPLTEIAREGARRMLAEALKAEADAFVASFVDETLSDAVMHDPQQEPRQHQTDVRRDYDSLDRRLFLLTLWIDAGSPRTGGVEIGHFRAQPIEVQDPVDTSEDVVIGNKVTKRAADEELELVAGPTADHAILRAIPSHAWNQRSEGFSTAPRSLSTATCRLTRRSTFTTS